MKRIIQILWCLILTDSFLKIGKEVQPKPVAAFGFGRRYVSCNLIIFHTLEHILPVSCPGQYLALDTVWIAIASMASTLSFSKAVDSEGRVMEPSGNYTSGFVW